MKTTVCLKPRMRLLSLVDSVLFRRGVTIEFGIDSDSVYARSDSVNDCSEIGIRLSMEPFEREEIEVVEFIGIITEFLVPMHNRLSTAGIRVHTKDGEYGEDLFAFDFQRWSLGPHEKSYVNFLSALVDADDFLTINNRGRIVGQRWLGTRGTA